MEKIKDAIDKAKAQGNGRVRQTSAIRHKDSRILSQVDDELKSIKYTQSAVIELDSTHLEANRISAHIKHDPMSWTFDSLRTQVLQKMQENSWRTLAIVSPTPESGKSLIAINLSMSIAQQPQKTVMLVDFDLRKPRIAQYLGLSQKKSMNDYLDGMVELHEIIVNPSIPRFTVLPTNYPVKNSSEMLSSNVVQQLVLELKARYDSRIVIFDLPPMLNADDAMVLLPQVDCVLLVLGDGLHTEAEISETMRLLNKSNILGVVVNRAEVEPRAYY